MMTFNSIDVETANADRSSICQIGITHVVDGKVVDTWQSLINPEDWFDEMNIDIHGIKPKHVKHSPTLPQVRNELRKRLRGMVLVSHTAFDRVAFERAMKKYDLEQLQVTWLDSARIIRRAYPERYGQRGYGLGNVAQDMGIEFNHHDALEDAKAAALIVLNTCKETDTDIDYWLEELEDYWTNTTNTTDTRKVWKRFEKTPKVKDFVPNEKGHLYGETVLFTGELSISRTTAMSHAAEAGCKIASTATKKLTLLVLGIQDQDKLKQGYDKSSKHRKVETLIRNGQGIQILSETDFMEVIGIEGAADIVEKGYREKEAEKRRKAEPPKSNRLEMVLDMEEIWETCLETVARNHNVEVEVVREKIEKEISG